MKITEKDMTPTEDSVLARFEPKTQPAIAYRHNMQLILDMAAHVQIDDKPTLTDIKVMIRDVAEESKTKLTICEASDTAQIADLQAAYLDVLEEVKKLKVSNATHTV
jgi:hypothetical protein